MAAVASKADVWVEFLPTTSGGRKAPAILNIGIYRPHLRVGNGEMLGVVFIAGPRTAVAPGSSANATVQFMYESTISYRDLAEGASFEILEGPFVVGRGRVVKLNLVAQQA